jgi:hypothetical protein
MAAIVGKDNLNLAGLRDHLARHLPEYARPMFLRLREANDVTSTFKSKKIDLVKQGFDPSRTDDRSISMIPAARPSSGLTPRCTKTSPRGACGCDRRCHHTCDRDDRAGGGARVLAHRRPGQMVCQGRRFRRRDRGALWHALVRGRE